MTFVAGQKRLAMRLYREAERIGQMRILLNRYAIPQGVRVEFSGCAHMDFFMITLDGGPVESGSCLDRSILDAMYEARVDTYFVQSGCYFGQPARYFFHRRKKYALLNWWEVVDDVVSWVMRRHDPKESLVNVCARCSEEPGWCACALSN